MTFGDSETRVGTVLRGKWTLDKRLGSGGMAHVYAASHKIGRRAAVKLLHPEIALDEQVRARFEQEALAVNSIGHPGVVEIIDIDSTDDGIHFLVMELLEGETLADRFERDANFKLDRLLDIVDQLLDVLVACHAKGIVHRDIKPENLFLQSNGKLKVLDFGIARMRDGLRTQAGTMLGTVAFSPPEQLKGAKVDQRADLFSVGATLFTIIARRRVHETANSASLSVKMLTTAAPPLGEVAPDTPEGVCLVVDRALAFLADRRYPDARTMRGDVWALQKGQRPPYAYACREAGLSPHITKPEVEPSVAEEAAPGSLPATAEQSPMLAREKVEAARPGLLPSTQPQLPAFMAGGDGPAESEAAPSEGVPRSTPSTPTRQEGTPPSDKEDSQEGGSSTLVGGFESPRQWRTDPRWPVPAVKDGDEADSKGGKKQSKPTDEPPESLGWDDEDEGEPRSSSAEPSEDED